eukprot:4557401-Alexandrium_andersonii.AAC.1
MPRARWPVGRQGRGSRLRRGCCRSSRVLTARGRRRGVEGAERWRGGRRPFLGQGGLVTKLPNSSPLP